MVRLTVDLINKCGSTMNPLKQRELHMRGQKITAIENLGAAVAMDCDAIDFVDNELTELGNFPLMPRMILLLCQKNRISRILPSVPHSVLNLYTMALDNNNFTDLASLWPLGDCKKLVNLSLRANPVNKVENYRLFMIFACPSVRYLDYQHVKDVERAAAKKLFGTRAEPNEFAKKILDSPLVILPLSASTAAPSTSAAPATRPSGAAEPPAKRVKLSKEQTAQYDRLIKEAKNDDAVLRLEKMIDAGLAPPQK